MKSKWKIALESRPSALVMRVSGDLRIWGHEEEQERMLKLIRAQDPPTARLILDISQVHHIDTAGVGALARVLIECGKCELDLRVVPPSGAPGLALKRLHIFDAWPTFPDEVSLLAWLGELDAT